jgi:hypothetical protein
LVHKDFRAVKEFKARLASGEFSRAPGAPAALQAVQLTLGGGGGGGGGRKVVACTRHAHDVCACPSADKLLVFNDGTKEFEVADIGTGLVLTGGALDAENAVDSVNGEVGVVVLDADDISDSGTTNKWNVTHTGEVTGATTLTVDKTAISNRTLVTAAVGDTVLIGDQSDSDNLKKVTVQTIVNLAAGGTRDYVPTFLLMGG